MRVYDIEILKKGEDGFYDLFQNTFDYTKVTNYSLYTVSRGEEMRIDLISNKIYGTTNYVDILLALNNIDNPLNIKAGSVIFYPISDLLTPRITPSEPEVESSSLILDGNIVDKSTRIDPNRQIYNKNNNSLPPTILERKTGQIDISGSSIVFGSNLFKN